MLLSYKPLHLGAQQRLQEEGCVVDIRAALGGVAVRPLGHGFVGPSPALNVCARRQDRSLLCMHPANPACMRRSSLHAPMPRCADRACMRRCVRHDALTEQLSCTPAATDAATVTAIGSSLLARWLHICGLCKKKATPLLSCTHSSLLTKLACMH